MGNIVPEEEAVGKKGAETYYFLIFLHLSLNIQANDLQAVMISSFG